MKSAGVVDLRYDIGTTLVQPLRTRRPPCRSGRPGRRSTARSPRRAGCPCRWACPGTSTTGSLASNLHWSLSCSPGIRKNSSSAALHIVSDPTRSMSPQRTSMQDAPSVAVFYKLQKRASHDGGIPLGEITPALPTGRHYGDSEQSQHGVRHSSVTADGHLLHLSTMRSNNSPPTAGSITT